MIAKVPRLIGKANGQNFNDHLEAFNEVIKGAEKILIAVAFFKLSGLKLIIDAIEERLNDDSKIEIFVGRDLCTTEPRALERILEISTIRPSLTVYFAHEQQKWIFHPKMYLGQHETGTRLLIGSANLTKGALKHNEELSLLWEIETEDTLLTQIHNVFARYRSGDIFKKLDKKMLEQYTVEHKKSKSPNSSPLPHKKGFDIDSMCDLELLNVYFEEFLQVTRAMEEIEFRRKSRKAALKVQRKIAKMAPIFELTKTERKMFESLYYSLVSNENSGPHWLSNGVGRLRSRVCGDPMKVINLFAAAEMVADLQVGKGYRYVGAFANRIDGMGTNTLSELLCTFAPKKYAVYSGITEDALRKLGAYLVEPTNPNSMGWKDSIIHPDRYNQVCKIYGRIRLWIKENGSGKSTGKDFSDLDAFFYWISSTKS